MTQWGLDALFNPGKRHMDDEKRRLQSTREEIGDSSGGRRIDLEAGKVSISVPRSSDPSTDATADDDTDASALEPVLEVEEVPAVALANDEAEIEPEVVDDDGDRPEVVADVAAVEAVATDPAPAESDDELDAESDDEVEPAPAAVAPVPAAVADDVPIEAPIPEPVAATPRRKSLSASAWARRG